MAMMPVVGALVSMVPVRNIIAVGWVITAIAMFYSTQVAPARDRLPRGEHPARAAGGRTAAAVRADYRGLVSTRIAARKSNNVAGLLNFHQEHRIEHRHVDRHDDGGAAAREIHQSYLVSHTTPGAPRLTQAVAALAARLMRAGVEPSVATREGARARLPDGHRPGHRARLHRRLLAAGHRRRRHGADVLPAAAQHSRRRRRRTRGPLADARTDAIPRSRSIPSRLSRPARLACLCRESRLLRRSGGAGRVQRAQLPMTSMSSPTPAAQMQPEPMTLPADNPFLGSVRTGRATDATLPLSLAEAIERALAHNLGLALGTQDSRAARASVFTG